MAADARLVSAPDFAFAPADESDFERLLELRVLVMREHLERLGRFDPARSRQRFRDSFAPAHTRLILVDGALAGCVALLPEDEGWEVSSFFLYPRHQGGGLGSAVMRAILAEADAAGIGLRLQVLKQSPAQRFYERHDFHFTHEDDWDLYYRRSPASERA